MGLHLLYGAAVLFASVQAIAFPGPRPTDSFQALPHDGWSPRPTPGPDAHALLRRQLDLPATYLLAPDNTCGFINANSKSAYTCVDEDMKCAFIPSTGKAAGAAGCCKGDDCAFRVSCLDKSEVEDDCDKKCQSDALTLKCTGAAKYCNTVSFPGGVTDYFCATRKTRLVLRAQTTHRGDRTREMSTVKSTSTSTKKTTTKSTSTKSSSSSTSTRSSSSSSSSASSTSSEGSSVSIKALPTASSASDTAVRGAATSSTEPVATPAPATPTGAIVGGVLGGLALLALIVFGVVFLRQHKQKNADAAEAPPPPPFKSEPAFGGSQPAAGTFAEKSAASHVSGYPPTSAAPTPAHMYSVPAAAAVGAGAGIGAAAAAGASFRSHPSQHHPHDSVSSGYPTHSNSNTYAHSTAYPDPSPLTTPSSTPHPHQQQQHYQHQPHAPIPLPPPSYYNHNQYNHSPRQSLDHNNNNSWASPTDTPDRRDNSTPVSTYNGTTPVLPASALGPMPGEQHHQQHHHQHQQPQHQQQHHQQQHNSSGSRSGSGSTTGVPLSLQPGMGYRPYRPGGGGSVSGSMGGGSGGSPGGGNRNRSGTMGGDGSANGNGSPGGEVRAATGSPSPSPGPDDEGQQAHAVVVGGQQAHAVVVGSREARGVVVELP